MARYDHNQLIEGAKATYDATEDASGEADLVCDKGAIIVAAQPEDMKAAFKRAKKLKGYRWVLINEADLFAANTLSLGSKAGMLTIDGKVLKNADIPRKKV